MFSATVSVPIPWQKGQKQAALAASARAELSALEAEHHDRANSLRARVAELYSEIERARAQLALYVKAIIPQGNASLTSVTSSYQVGRADLQAVLESHATLYNYETAYWRGMSDFAARLAELEALVGKEILP
jgi:outer membrane protein TolC